MWLSTCAHVPQCRTEEATGPALRLPAKVRTGCMHRAVGCACATPRRRWDGLLWRRIRAALEPNARSASAAKQIYLPSGCDRCDAPSNPEAYARPANARDRPWVQRRHTGLTPPKALTVSNSRLSEIRRSMLGLAMAPSKPQHKRTSSGIRQLETLRLTVSRGEVVDACLCGQRNWLRNAIDAGARQITVLNMPTGANPDPRHGRTAAALRRAIWPLALSRHATSKNRRNGLLKHLTPSAFGGEALHRGRCRAAYHLQPACLGKTGQRFGQRGGVTALCAPQRLTAARWSRLRRLFLCPPARLEIPADRRAAAQADS